MDLFGPEVTKGFAEGGRKVDFVIHHGAGLPRFLQWAERHQDDEGVNMMCYFLNDYINPGGGVR
jgi:hypothetical protein